MSLFGTRTARICAVAAASTSAEMVRQVRAAWRQTPTVELRLDWLASDAQRTRLLAWLKRQPLAGKTVMATCRRVPAGGKFSGDIQAELYWLMQAREAGCVWCDVEVETLRELPGQSVRDSPVPERVLLSVHDFDRTPALPRGISVPRYGGVDALKIAAQAHTIRDSVQLIQLARRSKNFVAVPMGEVGLPARILALREGSALAYAPVGQATAPGQVSLAEMLQLYRAHQLTRATRVYGVIGYPVGHSLSPLLHNTGFVAGKVDALYLPFLVHRLSDFLQAIKPLGIRGFSVTIPHKQAVLKHLDECEPLAAKIGAVNTVLVRRNGSLYGCNTDYLGVLRALEEKITLRGSRVLIFGAGGAARAAAFAVASAGASLAVCARREKLARELARAAGGEALPRRALRSEKFDALINATPVGMHPHAGISPLAASELHCRIVMDLIYRPLHTELLKIAERRRIATISGLEMFLAQGFAQWELWTGKKCPEGPMRRAVAAALRSVEAATRKKRGSRA